MILLAVVVRTTPFKAWPVTRLAIVFLLALGTSLTAMLFFNPAEAFNFLLTLWVLPAITFVWALVLVLTHVNGDNLGRRLSPLRRPRAPAPPWPLRPAPDGPGADEVKTAVAADRSRASLARSADDAGPWTPR